MTLRGVFASFITASIVCESQTKGVGKRLFKAWLGHDLKKSEIDHVFSTLSISAKGKGVTNMAAPKNSGKAWTPAQNNALQSLARGNTPTRVAGLKLGRTPASVQSQASKLGISLKPTNQSPYGTKSK